MKDGTEKGESWWSRPAGGREVLAIALPMVASTLSWTLMTFVDRIILHTVSGMAMSAAFSSSITWFASLSLLWGVCTYTSTFVSQYHGDDQPERIGPMAWQGVWLAALFTPIALGLIPLAPWFFSSHAPEMAELETRFFQILCWGAPGMLAAQSLESFYSGRGKTWVVMLVDATAVLINLFLVCLLVLGRWGVESWGMEGAAWGTVTAQWCRALMYAALALRAANRRRYNTLRGWRLDRNLLARLLRFGGPSGAQMTLDVGGFALFIILVGQLGPVQTEATSAVFTVSHLAFMPVWGLGMATTVLVGQHLGESRSDLANRAVRTTLVMAMGYMASLSLAFVLAPRTFLAGFNGGAAAGAADPATVQALATDLLWFVVAYNMFDAAAIIFVSALKGAGDTRFIMIVSGAMAVAVVAATWMGINWLDVGVYGCWIIITAMVWTLGVVYVARYRQGKWRSMRVIEQIHHGAEPIEQEPSPSGSGNQSDLSLTPIA